MKRSHALDLLAQSKPVLATRYGVTHLALFGSTARDSARADSDIDIVVAFDGPATSEATSASSSISKTCSVARSIW